MTTSTEMAAMAATNAETSLILEALGTPRALRAAAAIRECTSERRTARGRWPEVCGRAGCAWCSKPLLAGWPAGQARWAQMQRDLTTFRVTLDHEPGEILGAVRVARRAIRDLRDRRGRGDYGRLWRGVAMEGFAGADGLRLHVHHRGLGSNDVCALIRRRWPSAKTVPVDDPVSISYDPEDRAALALHHRGAQGLRVVIGPQGSRPVPALPSSARSYDPLPSIFPTLGLWDW